MLFDVVGTLGVVIIIATYVLLQTERIRSDSLIYSALNAGGASMIAFSLVFNFNFPEFIVEIFWIAISVFGIVKALRR